MNINSISNTPNLSSNNTYKIKSIVLNQGNNELRLNPMGARIERLVLNGQLVLTTVKRLNGKIGSTHPCIPIFGQESNTSYGLKQHGEARDKLWLKDESEESEIRLFYEAVDAGYPRGLKITQSFKLKNGCFELRSICQNNGEEEVPVYFAQHNYFNALPGGWGGLKINGQDVSSLVAVTGFMKVDTSNSIVFNSTQFRPILFEQQGLPFVVLWNETPDNAESEWVCIEPAEARPDTNFFGSPESMIASGQNRTTMIRLSVK